MLPGTVSNKTTTKNQNNPKLQTEPTNPSTKTKKIKLEKFSDTSDYRFSVSRSQKVTKGQTEEQVETEGEGAGSHLAAQFDSHSIVYATYEH